MSDWLIFWCLIVLAVSLIVLTIAGLVVIGSRINELDKDRQ